MRLKLYKLSAFAAMVKFIKQVTTGLLISAGFFWLAIAVVELIDKYPTSQQQQEVADTIIAGLKLSVPLLSAAGWIV